MKKVVQLYEAFVSSGLVIFKAELRPLSTKLQKNRSAGGIPATADSFTLHFTIKSKKKQERTALYRNFSAKGRLLLVPGQVEDDASVRLGGCGLFSNVDLLKAVRERHPDAFIIYKPHPDVESRNRKGRIPDGEALRYADRVVRNVRMDVLLGIVDEVHTLTSLTGFEALLRGIEVHTYGGPFYAGWGLTHDRVDFPRRKARLSLEELIAGTLILYPSYYDWQTKGFCTPEDICYRLTQPKGQMRGKFFMRTFAALREKIRNVF